VHILHLAGKASTRRRPVNSALDGTSCLHWSLQPLMLAIGNAHSTKA
jgi:hypothetical protein